MHENRLNGLSSQILVKHHSIRSPITDSYGRGGASMVVPLPLRVCPGLRYGATPINQSVNGRGAQSRPWSSSQGEANLRTNCETLEALFLMQSLML
jgi:hypothetical protein